MRLPRILSKLFSQVSTSPNEEDEDIVTFAGADEPSADSAPEDYEFGIEVLGQWLPAVTSNEDVIRQLKEMKIGQAFRITNEESVGGLGTRVHAIEVINKNSPVPVNVSKPKI